jgi:hypothetical protein
MMDQETRIAFNTPARVTNRFVAASMKGAQIRVAFAEAAPGESKAFVFHSAIMCSLDDAAQLAETLTRLVRQARGQA